MAFLTIWLADSNEVIKVVIYLCHPSASEAHLQGIRNGWEDLRGMQTGVRMAGTHRHKWNHATEHPAMGSPEGALKQGDRPPQCQVSPSKHPCPNPGLLWPPRILTCTDVYCMEHREESIPSFTLVCGGKNRSVINRHLFG